MPEDKQGISEFILKLLDMLRAYNHLIDWNQDKTQIVIKDVKAVTEQVLPKYFRHGKYESFVRQLNIYRFYKVYRENENTMAFKNDLFYEGNEANYFKIKRKKQSEFKTKTSEELEQNLQFVINHPSLDNSTRSIFTELLGFKNVCQYETKKLVPLLQKLVPEMKATKFKRHLQTFNTFIKSTETLDKSSSEIEGLMHSAKQRRLRQVFMLDSERNYSQHFSRHKQSVQLSFSQPNLGSTLLEELQERKVEKVERKSSGMSYQLQNFLSITKFLGMNELTTPTSHRHEPREDPRPVLEVGSKSHMSLDDNLLSHC